jgi:hypothetical protein
MFNELAKMFSGQRKERRHSPRKKARFNFVWLNGVEQVPGVGMEMSLNGCLIALKQAPPKPAFDVVMDVEKRKVRVRLNTARSGTIMRENQQWSVLGCTFSGVAADDYDALVRFLKGIAETGNQAQKDLALVNNRNDDAYRMLPLAVQQRVLGTLAQAGRVEIPPEGQAPLLRMVDRGTHADGSRRRLAVHSRVITKAGPEMFDSVIVIDAGGRVKIEI